MTFLFSFFFFCFYIFYILFLFSFPFFYRKCFCHFGMIISISSTVFSKPFMITETQRTSVCRRVLNLYYYHYYLVLFLGGFWLANSKNVHVYWNSVGNKILCHEKLTLDGNTCAKRCALASGSPKKSLPELTQEWIFAPAHYNL